MKTEGYTDEINAEANAYPRLGAEYFASREVAERFMAHWSEQHAEQFADAIIKPVIDQMTEKVWDAFRDFLLADTQQNIHTEMQRMVENSVLALIGGQKWANVKYISPEGYQTEKVRETLAKLYSDEIKDGRIADLEKQVASLTQRLEWARP